MMRQQTPRLPRISERMAHETDDSKEHLEPWFDDGNIVLVAGGQCFKVYRGTLSMHSPIFKDMFSCPNPPDQGEMIEGCAVVQLQDSASEGSTRPQSTILWYIDSSRSIPMSVATALLRLGKKYEFKLLFECVSSRVKDCYPLELPANSGPGTRRRNPHWAVTPWISSCLILFAKLGCSLVLPIALYACCFLNRN
ncbi:hypothetical protein EDD16DRAFT_903628 [Pisolithus croceorrhizus]|nr:hypothetical protein EDD16DRAFT_903628 [Pisolithus croceorrhizus]